MKINCKSVIFVEIFIVTIFKDNEKFYLVKRKNYKF